MIFSPEDIQQLFSIVDFRLAKIVADVLGVGLLTPEDKDLLIKNRYNWKNELHKIPPYYQSFLFGRLSSVLSPSQLRSLDYHDFSLFIDKKQFKTLSTHEKAVYNAAATRTYSYIKSMGQRMKDIITNAVSQEEINLLMETQRQLEHSTIKKEILEGTLKKKSVQNIVSNIGHSLNDWNRDWGRIVETELQDIYQIGMAQTIMEEHGSEAIVYKEVFPGACKHCIRLYTTGGIGTKPRLFKLIDLIANGDNIGVKVANWKPTLGPVHPFCYDDKTEVLTNEGFKFFKDLNKDENFLSINLEDGNGEWCKAIGWIEEKYEGKMLLREHKSFSLMTTPNHNHVIAKSNFKWFLGTEKDIFKSTRFLRSIPNWKGESVKSFVFDKREYDSKLFCEFMGYFLSEGSTVEYGSRRIHIAQSKEKYLQKMFDCCVQLFPNANKCSNYIEIRLYRGDQDELWDYMKQFGHSHDKFIPQNIKELNKECIEIFLEAFRLGDGSIRKGRDWDGYKCKDNRVFSTSSPRLADDIGELILKIGKRPSYRNTGKVVVYDKKYQKTYTSKFDQIYIDECFNTTAISEALQPKEIDYNGYIYDVELEKNHTLIIRRNGKICISGNCRCQLRYTPKGYVWSDEEKMFVPPKNYERKIERRSKVKIYVGDKTFEV
jgi:hypothetical protein